MYKHGVGYVERRGKIEKKKELKLTFKKDVLNDLLKSLCVFSTGRGKVSDISYETPEDISKILEEKAIRVPEREAMIGLFRQLKGYAVEIERIPKPSRARCWEPRKRECPRATSSIFNWKGARRRTL